MNPKTLQSRYCIELIHWDLVIGPGAIMRPPLRDSLLGRIRYRAIFDNGPCSDHLLGEKRPDNETV